jgi:hypothetical protein
MAHLLQRRNGETGSNPGTFTAGFRAGARQPDNTGMRLVLLLACPVLFALPLRLEAATRESVDQLFTTLDMRKSWDLGMRAIEDGFDRELAGAPASTPLPQDRQRQRDATLARISNLMRTEMSWEAVGGEIGQIYADVFTQAEIDAMTAFYSAPVGHAVMAKAPALIGALMQGNADLTHNDALTPEESSAVDAFAHSAAAESMRAKSSLVLERLARVSQAHLARMRPQMEKIVRDAQDAAKAP